MKEKILVLGKGESALCFYKMCKELGIASTRLESFDSRGSCLKDASIIVQLLEDSLDVSNSAGVPRP